MPIRQVAANTYRISLAWSSAYALLEDTKNDVKNDTKNDTENNKKLEDKKPKDAVLIDCGLQKDRPALLDALRELGVKPSEVRSLLLTHAHCDHAGNAAFFAKQGTQIVTHTDEARFLEPPLRGYAPRGLNALRRPLTSLAFACGESLYPVERCPVTRKVTNGEIIAAPGGPLRVVHSPGHTPGHLAFYREQDGVLFSGDAILNIIPVRRETGLSLPIRMLSDNWKQTRRSALRLAQLAPRLLLSGHGLPLTENTAHELSAWAEGMSVRLFSAFRGKT